MRKEGATLPGPNTYKVTWQYTGPLGTAWNEVYYATGSNPTDLLVFNINAINGRLALLSPICFHSGISVALVGGTRSTALRKTGWPGTGTATGGPAIPESAMVCNLVGASGGSRKIWLRGLPEFLIGLDSTGGRSIFGAFTTAAFNQYISGLASMGYGLRTLQPTTRYTIASVAPGVPAGTAVITYAPAMGQPAPTFATGGRAVFALADLKTLPGLRGHFTILATAVNSITVRYNVANAQTIVANCGYVRAETYSGVSIFAPALCATAYWGAHDTKVFTRGSRGARRAQRVRPLA